MNALRRHSHRKSAVVNLKNQDVNGGAAGRGASQRAQLWAALSVFLMSTGVALGQPEKPESGPLEDTWQYLLELFRMMLGI